MPLSPLHQRSRLPPLPACPQIVSSNLLYAEERSGIRDEVRRVLSPLWDHMPLSVSNQNSISRGYTTRATLSWRPPRASLHLLPKPV